MQVTKVVLLLKMHQPLMITHSSVYNISVKCLQKKLKPLKQPEGEILSSKVWQCGKQLTLHQQQRKPDESKATFSACWKKTAHPTKTFKTEVEIKTFQTKPLVCQQPTHAKENIKFYYFSQEESNGRSRCKKEQGIK